MGYGLKTEFVPVVRGEFYEIVDVNSGDVATKISFGKMEESRNNLGYCKNCGNLKFVLLNIKKHPSKLYCETCGQRALESILVGAREV